MWFTFRQNLVFPTFWYPYLMGSRANVVQDKRLPNIQDFLLAHPSLNLPLGNTSCLAMKAFHYRSTTFYRLHPVVLRKFSFARDMPSHIRNKTALAVKGGVVTSNAEENNLEKYQKIWPGLKGLFCPHQFRYHWISRFCTAKKFLQKYL